MAESIDDYLKTTAAKKNSITSRADFITRIVAAWFSENDPEYKVFTTRVDHMSLAEYKEFMEQTKYNQRLVGND